MWRALRIATIQTPGGSPAARRQARSMVLLASSSHQRQHVSAASSAWVAPLHRRARNKEPSSSSPSSSSSSSVGNIRSFHYPSSDALAAPVPSVSVSVSSSLTTSHEETMKKVMQALMQSQRKILRLSTTFDDRRLEHWILQLNQMGQLTLQNEAAAAAHAQRIPVFENTTTNSNHQPLLFSASHVPEYDGDTIEQEHDDDEEEEEPELGGEPEDQENDGSKPPQPVFPRPLRDAPDQIKADFAMALQQQDLTWGMQIIEGVVRHLDLDQGQVMPLSPESLMEMFHVACRKQAPLQANHLMRLYIWWDKHAHQETDDRNLDKYDLVFRHMMKTLENLGPGPIPKNLKVVGRIYWDIENCMSREVQEIMFPRLLSSILVQQCSNVRSEYASRIYNFMVDHDFEEIQSPNYMVHLLRNAKYTGKRDLPFVDLLETLVDRNIPLEPMLALRVLEVQYPFNDFVSTSSVLRSIIRLVEKQQGHEVTEAGSLDVRQEQSHTPRPEYRIDITTFETIGSVAAKMGAHEVNLLLWELIELLGVSPSAGVYEDTAIAFVGSGPDFYKHVFSVLAEMEEVGYKPCRALIKGIAKRFRRHPHLCRQAQRAMMETVREGRTKVTIAGMNTVVAGFAERGMIQDMKRLMELMERGTSQEGGQEDIIPNSDTYTFLMEGLGKHLGMALQDKATQLERGFHYRKFKVDEEGYITNLIQRADDTLNEMEAKEIDVNSHIVRDYVELLCLAGDLETATSVVFQYLEDGKDDLINSKTLYRVSKANYEAGNEEIARELSSFGSDNLNLFNFHKGGESEHQEHDNENAISS